MYSTHNEGESVGAERFIRAIKRAGSTNTWLQY